MVEKKTVLAHDGVESFFSGMPERRMPDVVDESQRFNQVDVQPELSSNGPRDLGHFQRMSEAIAKMIGMPKCEDLRFIFEPAESTRMDDAVPVALEIIAIGMRRLGEAAPAGLFHAYREVSEHVGRIAKFGSQEWAFTVREIAVQKKQPKRLSFCNSVFLVYCFSPSSFATLTLAASNFF